jgi:molybdopterin converting factor subunit 1
VAPDPAAEIVPKAITVQVRLFAAYREVVGTTRLTHDLPTGSTVADLLARLHAQYPGLRLESGMVAVNQEYVKTGVSLRDGDEVALIPPVSGGAR